LKETWTVLNSVSTTMTM